MRCYKITVTCVICAESSGSWKLLAAFLNKSLENETTKQRLYYFYNFFCENRQVILQLLLHFIATIHNSDNLVFVL